MARDAFHGLSFHWKSVEYTFPGEKPWITSDLRRSFSPVSPFKHHLVQYLLNPWIAL
jgi:hypothetical protein